ncbi:hypothetical protein CDD83_927 [Cordyceps sp. RAO-2017]|nr:hypothetical protein CDD83_927 [Cordyceps sp. RAO-2017]
MPGILPMKVIKVGNSAQSRIAQACDRCRSKKIRCDGVRPTCSQCANVGFECRTSDKLSRRAFPRGYTESLEERVRLLEAEVRELKDLLDEKDEKLDMLSAMHAGHHHHSHHRHRPPAALTPAAGPAVPAESSPDAARQSPAKQDSFRVQAAPLLLGLENSDSYLMGPSSGLSLITSLKRKLQEAGKPCNDFNPDAFLHVQGCPPLTTEELGPSPRLPPRLFSDRCVNVYFQEWAPLFPVLHKPTFLHAYEEFVASPERVRCNYKLAQLYLVFSIAGLSSAAPDLAQVACCERQWIRALDDLLPDNTMNTLQCLILALVYCTLRADNKRLQHYKSIAVGLSHRLGLHQSQKRFSFGALTLETRKRVFWTLYTLDCFTAATMGLPKLLKEDGVETEYPSDTDDEYITEKGFQPTMPGESTRLSSALALFRASRILGRVLEALYPATTNHELSLRQMSMLEGELDAWYAELPAHLRLNFVQDKPSTDVTGSRSPVLALTYYYIRTLIYRPAVGSSLGPKAASALMSIAESSKHMIQVVQLLEERNMSFSLCLNKSDLLAVCAVTLLYQVADLKQDSKLTRDVGRLVNAVLGALVGARAAGSVDLERVARCLITVDNGGGSTNAPSSRPCPMAAPSQRPTPPPPLSSLSSSRGTKKKTSQVLGRFHATASTAKAGVGMDAQDKMRRMTMPPVSAHEADVFRARCRQALSAEGTGAGSAGAYRVGLSQGASIPNLDYLSLSNTPSQTQPPSPSGPGRMAAEGGAGSGGEATGKVSRVLTSDWEALLGSLDGGMHNLYDAIYGGASLLNETSLAQGGEWSPDSWDLGGFSLGDLGRGGRGAAQSVLSMSDESLSSGEEVAPSELGLSVGSAEFHKQQFGGERFAL